MRVLLGYYRQGYTLVEIVIIIAVLAALAVTVIVAHNGYIAVRLTRKRVKRLRMR